MDRETRVEIESALGQELSSIRIHTGPEAAASSVFLGADAYAAGNHIAFAAGRYSPQTSQGRRTLAHELSHVIQTEGRLPLQWAVHRPHDSWELAAERAASAVEVGRRTEVRSGAAPGIRRLRDPRLESILARIATLSPQEIGQILAGVDLEDQDNFLPLLAGLAGRPDLQELLWAQYDEQLLSRTPGFFHFVWPTVSRRTYRYPIFKDPILRGQHTTAATFGALNLGRDVVMTSLGSATAIQLLLVSGLIAPAALKGGIAGVLKTVGGKLALAPGSLHALGTSAMSFYLSNPILVNELGILGAGLVLSVEGDVAGLLEAIDKDPLQAIEIFMQVWVIKGTAQTPDGRQRKVRLRVRPKPPKQQTDPRRLQLKVIETALRSGRFKGSLRYFRDRGSGGLTVAERRFVDRQRAAAGISSPRTPGSKEKTFGVLVLDTGEVIPLPSRQAGPAAQLSPDLGGTRSGFTGATLKHTEGHACAAMHRRGARYGVLLIDNRPCAACDSTNPSRAQISRGDLPRFGQTEGGDINISRMLPAGARLDVIDPHSKSIYRSSRPPGGK